MRHVAPQRVSASSLTTGPPAPLVAETGPSTIESWLARMVVWWACCPPNRLADQAGGYRRMAIGLACVPVPLLILGSATLRQGEVRNYAVVHVVLAGACLWMAVDLVRGGAIVDRRGWPLASVAAVTACLGSLVALRPPVLEISFGPRAAVVPADMMLVVGLVVLMAAEWRGDRLASMAGRWLLVAGATVLGFAAAIQAASLLHDERAFAVGLIGLALILVATAYFEARVLVRGAALLRLPVRR